MYIVSKEGFFQYTYIYGKAASSVQTAIQNCTPCENNSYKNYI